MTDSDRFVARRETSCEIVKPGQEPAKVAWHVWDRVRGASAVCFVGPDAQDEAQGAVDTLNKQIADA